MRVPLAASGSALRSDALSRVGDVGHFGRDGRDVGLCVKGVVLGGSHHRFGGRLSNRVLFGFFACHPVYRRAFLNLALVLSSYET